ncbi:MAG: Histidine triad (HIT) protein [Candidatus Woesebacteria bacterium GW2011_GWB1_45_5]|uniref:Histidine triad (HIT) protein n=1 Tax=Candidatus Woesebacteria bacterium GW2011_GWB1_45_5 TaxID=1618581 RepID=A0A0G1MLS5_9BACT|nr:MAG: Histidine triad (HIT) protein [Candidatus Woesebacteria bacterium GW2011_GWB1_45_5]
MRENNYTGVFMQDDCVFCKIVKKELPSKIEYEDDDLIVFQNINPIAPVHVLVVPKKHTKNLSDVSTSDKEMLGKLLLVVKEMSTKLGISSAFRVATANGENAGQTVFHLHFHLTGGWKEKYNRDEDKA